MSVIKPMRFAVPLVILSALVAVSVASSSERPPNVILILADDMGYGDVGFNGAPESVVRTPHLDRLAAEGLVLRDFHSNGAACTPTRAALLTGRYQQRSGLTNAIFVGNPRQARFGFAPDEVLIPSVLRKAGYRSAIFGKWHLGSPEGAHPLNHGFDRFIGNIEGHVDYISKWNRIFYDWNDGFEKIEEDGYVTHLLTQYTIEYIEENQDRPFFIFLSHACPHTPHMLPDDEPMYGSENPVITVQPEKYYPMIEEMDQGVGEILAKLEELGLDERTLVIFTADNGAHPRAGTGSPYRGAKGDVYEGGHRMPFAARWPGTIEAGSTSDETTMTMDLMPTFIELAGLPQPSEPALDGVSLRPLIDGDGEIPERLLFWDNFRGWAVRDGDLKWVGIHDQDTRVRSSELYNLAVDPGEANDISGEMPAETRRLVNAFRQWSREVQRGAVRQPAY